MYYSITTPMLIVLLFLLLPTLSKASSAVPLFHQISFTNNEVEQFSKFEANFHLEAVYNNPYDYDEIAVTAIFISPSKKAKTVDGFFMQDYDLNTTTGGLTTVGSGLFKVRFAPDEVGVWQVTFSVTDNTGVAHSERYEFQCTPKTSANNHGFLRTTNTNYLAFDDGEPYIAIGENIAWQKNNRYTNYKNWLESLIAEGGNFFRLWHAHWGLGIEWNDWGGFQRLRQYQQTNCFYQDWLFDYCAENGVYIMLTLQHHGPVSTQVNPNWNDSPYNVANGGPCENTIDFFTNETAIAHTKNRYRYIIARWGYSRSILCWELFNEAHWTNNFHANKALVAEWHIEMGAYLKSIDPNQHLISTSYGDNVADDAEVWEDPNYDFTQSHTYLNSPNLGNALAKTNWKFLNTYQKPTLIGEFGLGTGSNLSNADPDGIHFHNALWSGLFSGAFGTAMTWWWDSYVHPRNLYYHFASIAQLTPQIPFVEKQYQPAIAYAIGAPEDLTIIPSLNWSGIGIDAITIDEQGLVSPVDAQLGAFLYGTKWNTKFRSPPIFTVEYPIAGQFSVKTGSQIGKAPKIAIWLDDHLLLSQPGSTNTIYTVDIPAGKHTLKVDNIGEDWITINYYEFQGLGSQIEPYVLTSADARFAAGWALNKTYNHQFVVTNGVPKSTPIASIIVEDFEDGQYLVDWYDPLTASYIGAESAIAENNTLRIPVNPFLWDVVFLVTPDNTVSTTDQLNLFEFSIAPNPALVGTTLQINLPTKRNKERAISLLDLSGKLVYQVTNIDRHLILPSHIPAGFYWVKIEQDGQVGAKPIVIKN